MCLFFLLTRTGGEQQTKTQGLSIRYEAGTGGLLILGEKHLGHQN